MERETLSAILLVVIIVVALSAYLVIKEDILSNIFEFEEEEETNKIIEIGDCADIYYTGMFENGTVFDSSYLDPENKTDGVPLYVYVTKDLNAFPPEGYEQYSQGLIDGFMDGLIGLEEGTETTIGPIAPENAYGKYKAKIGDTFTTGQLMVNGFDLSQSLNITVEITNLTDSDISLRWINIEDFDKFTMPEAILNDLYSTDPYEQFILVPPHYIWENSTEVIEITNDSVTVKTTPTSTENITEKLRPIKYGDVETWVFPGASTASYDDSTITIENNPSVGDIYTYTFSYYGMELSMNLTVRYIDTVNDTLNLSLSYEGFGEQYQDFNKTITFDREYTISRDIDDIPLYYASSLFQQDLEREDLSLNELAGETLYFEVLVEKVYKTSQS